MAKFFLFLIGVSILFGINGVFASEDDRINRNAANFLAEKGIIETSDDYKLDTTITRREMLKVMMNLSGKDVSENCEGKFQDLDASDWGCKYAEAALAEGYITANENFRPDDEVSDPEGIKMIMQARNIPKATELSPCLVPEGCPITNWERAYTAGAAEHNLYGGGKLSTTDVYVEEVFTRASVFGIASRTYPIYKNDVQYWRVYSDEYFSVSYPEIWHYRYQSESKNGYGLPAGEGINFGDVTYFYGGSLDTKINPIDISFEEYIKENGYTVNDYETIQINDSLIGNVFGTSRLNIFIEGQTQNYIIGGSLDNEYFERFYQSFQIKN